MICEKWDGGHSPIETTEATSGKDSRFRRRRRMEKQRKRRYDKSALGGEHSMGGVSVFPAHSEAGVVGDPELGV